VVESGNYTTFPATLFDYNGVLVDDEHVHLSAFQRVLEPLGVVLTEQAYWERYLGYDDIGAFSAILSDAGQAPTRNQVTDLVEAKRPVYLELARTALRGFDGAASLVRSRARSGPVAIVSGALRDEIELGLRVLDVTDAVQHIVAAEDAPTSKPDPAGYLLGIDWLERSHGGDVARRALVIEDSIAGIEAAKAAGLCCVAVAHSYPTAELHAAGADAVFDTLASIDEGALAALYVRIHVR
jgi:beta-phosphoglucomutase-like phosphatase (HAD superfamily)